jgi:hypothetical protein
VSRDAEARLSVARVTKQRELELEGELAFRLDPVQLGTNRRGKPVTSCVVREADLPVRLARLSSDEQAALNVLFELVAEAGRPDFPGVPEGTPSVIEAAWRERFYERCKPGASSDARQKAYRRAVDSLIAGGRVATASDRVWVPAAGQTRTNPDPVRP